MFPQALSWTGATLPERLAHVRSHAADTARSQDVDGSIEPGDDSLQPWARACALGDLTAFVRRLSWDDIDLRLARAALASDAPTDFPTGPWVRRISDFAAEAGVCAPVVGTPEWDTQIEEVASESPFIDAWVPVLRVARRQLSAASPACREWLSDEAIGALERYLVKEISHLGGLALFEDFQSQRQPGGVSRTGYESYVSHLLAYRYDDFLAAFPVLARHVVLLVDQWVEQITDLVSRASADRAAIESNFESAAGRIVRLTPGLSDRHAGGRRVMLLEFASGLRLAYKPRDVRLERVFNEWLMWLRESGAAFVPRPPRVLDCGTHGWVRWVEQADLSSTEAVRAYFRSAGALVCLAHMLGGTDLHSENLIASAEGPVLVDTEMLLQPSTVPLSTRASGSCLYSGLVSLIAVDSRGKPFNMGGFQPSSARELRIPIRRWLNLRRDDIQFVQEHQIHPALRNDVRLDGCVQRPQDFVDDLCTGFESTYRFLESNRAALLRADGPLSGFTDCSVRVLFRPSDQYGAAEYLLAAPRYQRRGVDRSLALETFDRVFMSEVVRPRLWPLVHDERQALEMLDIPRVTVGASATDLTAASGEVVHAYYASSGAAGVRRRLSAFSSGDLAYQIDQITAALGSSDATDFVVRAGDEEPDNDPRDAAESVGLAVLACAQQGADGSLRWVACRSRTNLYAGASGIGLFFAALAAVTMRETWRDAARQALRGIEAGALDGQDHDAWGGVGGCSGQPSVAYAVALAGHLLADERLIGAGIELARTLPPDAIDSDVVLDIEGGTAGALAALLAVHELRPDDRLLALASRCASRLLATQIESGADRGAWLAGEEERARAGFAHGAAGIAYALCRWAAYSTDDAVRDAVHRAWRFERRLFQENNGVWPTVRRDGGHLVMAAWCHGAPGMALARACAPAAMADSYVSDEIAAAIRQTLSAPDAHLDHVCCGNLSRAEVAFTVGLRTGTTTWTDSGVTRAKAVAARILSHGRLGMRGRGFQHGAPVPHFFQGLAGIGYQLLRTSSPSILPSVLAFEPPPAAPGASPSPSEPEGRER